jgi:PAS domain S-box-containing protein
MTDIQQTPPPRSTTRHRPRVSQADGDGYYRKVLDGLPAAIYTTDASGRITYYNEAAAILWGHRPEIGKSEWCGSWKLFWPDGRALPHGECPMAMAIKEKKQNRGMEAVAERPDGSRVPFIPYPTPLFDDDGELIGAVNMLVDISERKRAEEVAQRLAAVVECSDDAILTKDLNGIIATWNKGAERIFGYTADEIVGKPVLLLIPPEQQDEEPVILSRIRKGERIDHYETIRRRKDGSLIDISLTVSPVRGPDGTVVGASKIARDISKLKQVERHRALLLREMEHRIKNLFALAGSVVALSARAAATPRELAQTVGARLNALARAHALTLSAPSLEKANRSAMLHDILRTILAPFDGEADNGKPRISITGINIPVSAETVTNFALLLHEFATNAAKYGALSVSNGTVEITSSQSGDKVLLAWLERGGPRVDHVIDHEGFGSILARSVTAQLGGHITRDWQPDGLCIRLSMDSARLTGAPHA